MVITSPVPIFLYLTKHPTHTPMKLSFCNLALFVSLFVLTGLVSCTKEKSIDSTENTNSGTDNGNGSGTGTGTVGSGSDSYFPSTKNSYWKYKTTGYYTLENTTTATGTTKDVNGITYGIYNSVNTGSPSAEVLYGTKDHNYYMLAQGSSPNSGASFDLNFLYTNDEKVVGGTWEHNAGQGNGFTALTPGKIVEKGISLTVNNKSYSDVIHSQILLQYVILGDTMTFTTYDFYIAKGVGIVRTISNGDPIWGGGISTTTDLMEYSIK